jgi:hypothetical protein
VIQFNTGGTPDENRTHISYYGIHLRRMDRYWGKSCDLVIIVVRKPQILNIVHVLVLLLPTI